jgi:hypothetical protein
MADYMTAVIPVMRVVPNGPVGVFGAGEQGAFASDGISRSSVYLNVNGS